MFIQTEPTPNPDTVKFLPGHPVAGDAGPFDFPDVASARMSLLARALFQVDGVERVFLGSDFVSINKETDKDWKHVKPMVLAAIMDHYMAGLP
ncbi:MAG TPA: NifU family protein, partial [Hyphomonas sp.]|nr:NifU family protein [Hyphomonas sp.]